MRDNLKLPLATDNNQTDNVALTTDVVIVMTLTTDVVIVIKTKDHNVLVDKDLETPAPILVIGLEARQRLQLETLVSVLRKKMLPNFCSQKSMIFPSVRKLRTYVF